MLAGSACLFSFDHAPHDALLSAPTCVWKGCVEVQGAASTSTSAARLQVSLPSHASISLRTGMWNPPSAPAGAAASARQAAGMALLHFIRNASTRTKSPCFSSRRHLERAHVQGQSAAGVRLRGRHRVRRQARGHYRQAHLHPAARRRVRCACRHPYYAACSLCSGRPRCSADRLVNPAADCPCEPPCQELRGRCLWVTHACASEVVLHITAEGCLRFSGLLPPQARDIRYFRD